VAENEEEPMIKNIVSFSLALFLSHAALAASPTLNPAATQQFLQSLVNTYSGTGHVETTSGQTTTSDYSFELQVTDENGVYHFLNDSDTDDLHSTDRSALALVNGVLYYSNDFIPNTPLIVTDSTIQSLQFHFSQIDAYGRMLTIEYRYTLSGKNLELHRTSTLNGVIVSDDDRKGTGF
jgi:hypothetical protein